MTAADRTEETDGGARVTRTETICDRFDTPVERVWPILADFGGVGRYMPGVEVRAVEGEGVGAVRLIANPGGAVRERLETFDAASRSFSYRVLDPSPLTMRGYVGVVTLKPDGVGACRIEWGGRFATDSSPDPAAQKRGLEQFYRTSIAGLKALLARG